MEGGSYRGDGVINDDESLPLGCQYVLNLVLEIGKIQPRSWELSIPAPRSIELNPHP